MDAKAPIIGIWAREEVELPDVGLGKALLQQLGQTKPPRHFEQDMDRKHVLLNVLYL